MALLTRLRGRRRFPLPHFDLVPLEFDDAAVELLLDDVVACIGAEAPPAPPVRAAPTAGELRASIERHLRRQDRAARRDATDELRDALAELRRSLA